MNREKAEKKVKRKITRVKTCPFCGRYPTIKASVDAKHSKRGSIGHYAVRDACCKATGLGQTELFFCNNWKEPDFGLWKSMADRLVNDWNKRAPE